MMRKKKKRPKLVLTQGVRSDGIEKTLKDLKRLMPKIEVLIVRARMINGEVVEWYSLGDCALSVAK